MSTRTPVERVAGFSYVEVLVATVLVSVSLVPAIEALNSGITGGGVHAQAVSRQQAMQAKLEEVLALPFDDLDAEALAAGSYLAPTSYSDAPGANDRRLVYLARYDVDNADSDGNALTGGEAGLVWVRVAVAGTVHAVETLTRRM
jgi:type II secretory pathway pseudopilin PulG